MVPCRLRMYIVLSLKTLVFLLFGKFMGPQLGPRNAFYQIYRGENSTIPCDGIVLITIHFG